MKDYNLDRAGNGIACVLTAIQTDEVFRIVSLVLTCLSIALSIAYRVWTWWKKAKKDGKIEPEEIKELKDIIDDEKDKIKK